jgi:hypothetical protein
VGRNDAEAVGGARNQVHSGIWLWKPAVLHAFKLLCEPDFNPMIISDSVKMKAWERLVIGETLSGLSLPKKDGRIDLSGLELPEPKVLERWQTTLADVARIEPNGIFRNAKLRDLDFTGSMLNSIHFTESEIKAFCATRVCTA